ncbi:nucleotidyl transferase AbiEii/AbiGii toxin family protein [Streptomyces sp. NBC_01298]|uniref:nucleotidyl transferase AbiEii/AbiGii toxin family protein n=1 Tax=Streptomyces sp. NBC_01298 TaxID=2903817 RepID=UPI002E116AF6|nr:nucleotidyl transferase AbiEii/AbiGii toxin family protein [Streptomyces sp. NBC_01298]
MSAYETHVTVRCAVPAELARLASWSAERELKVTHIVLARGRMASQPMLTLPDRDGHEALVPRLRAAGFDPVRVKVETVPWTTEPPGPGGGYFEHHLKLRLPADHDRAALESMVVPHGSHVSWNARRVLPGGWQERFVTQRFRGTVRGAGAAMDVALRAVGASGDAGSLVLRGSMLMSRWFARIAREPHDLDFVVVPADWMI